MKQVMLFMIVLLLSFGANAASIHIANVPAFTSNATLVGINPNDSSVAVAHYATDGGEFAAANDVTSDVGTWASVEWTFNPEGNFSGGTIDLSNNNFMNITGDYQYTLYMIASHTYFFDLFNATADTMGFQLSVSALPQVPLPAALWLFAPAMLGFFGLRRKSKALLAA